MAKRTFLLLLFYGASVIFFAVILLFNAEAKTPPAYQ